MKITVSTVIAAPVQEVWRAYTTHSEAQQREGWQAILDNFARHVAGKLAASA